jgi:hypothetical protein
MFCTTMLGNVPAHVTRQHARIEVIAAARRHSDDQVDLAAFVEILDALLRPRGRGREQAGKKRCGGKSRCETSTAERHGHPP